MDKKTMAIIGTGRMGLIHAKAASHFDIDIIAGCAKSKGGSWKKFKETFKDAKYIEKPSTILNDDNIDYIVVALPWDEIHKLIPDILKCNKPVLIEKPICLDASGAEALRVAVSKNKYVALNRRYYNTVIRLKEKIKDSTLVNAHVSVSEPLTDKVARLGPGVKDNILHFSTIHVLDTLIYMFDGIKLDKVYKVGDSISIVMLYNDAPIFITVNMDAAATTTIVANFSNGESCVMSPLETMAICDGLTIEEKDGERAYIAGVSEVIQESGVLKPGIIAQMKAFLTLKGISINEALKVSDLIENIKKY